MSKKFQEEQKAGAPAYIVTFSDMVTLLLTFFVLLLSLAQTQDKNLFQQGKDSFVDSIQMLGVGMLTGRRETPEFGQAKIKYSVNDSDEPADTRTLNAKDEDLRRLFTKLKEHATALRSQITADQVKFSVTDIRFASGRADLTEASKRSLNEFSRNLQTRPDGKHLKLYVLGLASDQPTPKAQLLLSAKRAQAVAHYLNDLPTLTAQKPVYAWGAGAGGDWIETDGAITKDLHILIAVLSKDMSL